MPQESSVSPTKNIPTPAPARNLSDNSNVHHHVSLRFKPKESKYSGGDEEHLQDFIDSYLQTVEYYQLKTREKLQYFHNLFRDDALRFYNAQVKHRCSTFEDAVRIIYKHFKSLDVQQRAKTDLSNSSLSTFAEQEGSATKVLSSLRTFISSRTPQLPPRFRAETNKISFLKQTVLIQPGIKDKLVRINRETRFQSLYSTLENALQLHQKDQAKGGSPPQAVSSSKFSNPFSNSTQPIALRALFPCFGFRVWSEYINNSYLQSASKLLRDVYLKPGKEFELPSNHLLKLLHPLYGLADSGDYWNETFASHMKNDLGMKSSAEDISFFFFKAKENLKGLAGTYVDDALFAGDDYFMKHTEKTSERFDSKSREFDRIRFAGVYIESKEDRFHIHQSSYINRIELLDLMLLSRHCNQLVHS